MRYSFLDRTDPRILSAFSAACCKLATTISATPRVVAKILSVALLEIHVHSQRILRHNVYSTVKICTSMDAIVREV